MKADSPRANRYLPFVPLHRSVRPSLLLFGLPGGVAAFAVAKILHAPTVWAIAAGVCGVIILGGSVALLMTKSQRKLDAVTAANATAPTTAGGKEKPEIDEVFPLRGFPTYTYQRREALEQSITKFATSGTGVALVQGPTKSGKSVLVKKALIGAEKTAMGEPQNISKLALYVAATHAETRDEFWSVANANLGTFTGRSKGIDASESHEAESSFRFHWLVELGGKWRTRAERKQSDGNSAQDPANVVVIRELNRSGRALIIDDLHMLPRLEQQRIMKGLKPFVDEGGRLIVIAAGYRAALIPGLVPNMNGSFQPFEFDLWKDKKALAQIALDGWTKLGYVADESLATWLAENSFGSPQIMQRLSGHLVKVSLLNEASSSSGIGLVKPADESAFFSSLLPDTDFAVLWLKKLKSGPAGKGRIRYETHNYGPADGYRLIILAIRELLPSFELSQAQIHQKCVEITVADEAAPQDSKAKMKNSDEPVRSTARGGETTTKLKYLSDLAATPEKAHPSEAELDAMEEGAQVDPVLEVRGEGAASTLHLVDPLFAYALKWWPRV